VKIDKMIKRVENCGTKAMISYSKGCRVAAVVSFSFGMVVLATVQALTYFMAVDAGFENTNAIVITAIPLAGPLFLAVQLLIVGEGIPAVLFILAGCAGFMIAYAANRLDCHRLAVAAANSPVVPPVPLNPIVSEPIVFEPLKVEMTKPIDETADEFDLDSILAQTEYGNAAGVSTNDKATREEQVAEILEMLEKYSK